MATKLIDFWPDTDNCRDCLFTEAEAADEAVFLAAHQPMKVIRRYHGSSSRTEEVMSETDLLYALLAPDPSSGTLVLPITGASGVGKSHMIRWLDAHLKLRKDRGKRHVVRIPKSASLRGVLDRILKDLPKRYDPIREQLKGAKLPHSLLDATQTLNTQLRIALDSLGKAATQRLKDGKAKKDDRARQAHCSEKGLIALLKDPQISAHFDAYESEHGVIARIADRFLSGKKQGVDVEKFYFQENDLDFLLKQTTADLASVTRPYAQQLRNPERRAEAIGFLNEVVDSALGKLVELGGASLSEIFVDLRRQLHADDMELVLLVEDFAVLAGIQGPLMDAMIREAIRDGRRELCVMRTALAVTTGLLPETVMTRAQAEWSIDSKPFANGEEAIDFFCDFVGGYLNAARLGKKRLRAAYDDKATLGEGLEKWTPSFYDLHGEQLSDLQKVQLHRFGASKLGNYPLFPLNRAAIAQLADLNMKDGDTYRFDPRAMMHRVIRETVVANRALFAQKKFPPANFAGFNPRLLETRVSDRLHSAAGDQADRLAALVYFWGGAPKSAGEAAAIPAEIFEAFGAPALDWKATPEVRTAPSAPTAKEPSRAAQAAGSPDGRWAGVLADWRSKGTISQRDAAALRSLLADGIANWLDWDALLLAESTLNGPLIWLPKAMVGNPERDKAMAIAADDANLDDTKASNTFFTAITAVIRYEAQKSWNYPDGETDAVAYANLISRMASQSAEWLGKRGAYLRPSLVEPAARALLIDARILNLEGASSNNDVENVKAMLSAALPGEPVAGSDPWTRLKASAHAERAALLTNVLGRVAARQGGGNPQAVDATVLLRALKATQSTWTLTDLDPSLLTEAPSGVREPLRRLRTGLEDVVRKRQDEVGKWRRFVRESFGKEFVLPEIQELMRETIQKARENSVFRLSGHSYEMLLAKIKDVGAVIETPALAYMAIEGGTAFGEVLASLAQLDDRAIERTKELIDIYSRFLRETGREVGERLKDAPASPDEIATRLAASLDKLELAWTTTHREANT